MGSILNRMPTGFAGDVTRSHGAKIETGYVGGADIAYGVPVKVSGDKFVALEEGDAAADIYGFIVRSYPSGGRTSTDEVAEAGSLCGVLRSGYMAVPLAVGTAAKGAPVYVRTAVDTGKALGDIEVGSTAGNVAIPATFMGEADASGVVEIAYNI